MRTRTKILKELKGLITFTLGVRVKEINENSHLIDDLKFNHIDEVLFITLVESTFDITIPDEDIERFMTIKEFINYIETKL